MSTATVERSYAMTRLEAGDYLLPSNDGKTLWRIVSYLEDEGEKVWGYWRWDSPLEDTENFRDTVAEAVEMGDWTRWTFWAGPYTTRGKAIDAALTERS